MINKKSAGDMTGKKWSYVLAIASMHAYIIVQTLIFVESWITTRSFSFTFS